MLNEEQKQAFGLTEKTRSKRKATKDTTLYWPGNTVYYEIRKAAGYTAKEKRVIKAAMEHWENETCLRFQPLRTVQGDKRNQPRLSFWKKDGCWSYVGMQGGSQNVSLGDGCISVGTIAHELGHAIGFWHEQSRPDRDQYVRVNWTNIQVDHQHNFNRYLEKNVMSNVDYDYSSLMHYHLYGFGKDKSIPTLLPRDPFYVPSMGQRDHISFLDAKLANLIYKCDSGCPGVADCLNGGFRLNAQKNCACRCPEDWTGPKCETRNEVKSVPRITLTGSGEIMSPNYSPQGESSYPHNVSTMTLIKAGPAEQIRLTFVDFDLETDGKVCYDYIEILQENPFYGGKRYCGNGLPPDVVGEEIMVYFSSNALVSRKGYHATYVTEKKSGPITCKDPGPPENGSVLPNDTFRFEVDAKVELKCNLGYEIEGPSNLTCTPQGTWDAALPTCKALATNCPKSEVVAQGSCNTKIHLQAGVSTKIASPNFPDPYPNGQDCFYAITADAHAQLDLTFETFETEQGYDYVTVVTSTVVEYLHGNILPAPMESTDTLTVYFQSDNIETRKGFSASICAHF